MNLAWMDQEHFIWKKKYKFINWCLNILNFFEVVICQVSPLSYNIPC
jgi:hypothetical protein